MLHFHIVILVTFQAPLNGIFGNFIRKKLLITGGNIAFYDCMNKRDYAALHWFDLLSIDHMWPPYMLFKIVLNARGQLRKG